MGRETDVWELCSRYKVRWQDLCGPERLNALRLVGSEILLEAMPELLVLEMFTGNEVVRFSFPTAESPNGTQTVYNGDDVAKLLKEFA